MTTNFEKKYKMSLPMTTLDEFQKFEQALESDAYFKNDVVSYNLEYTYY